MVIMGGAVSLSLKTPRTDKIERAYDRRLKQLHNAGYQGGRIYSINGLSTTLNAAGNNGWYTE